MKALLQAFLCAFFLVAFIKIFFLFRSFNDHGNETVYVGLSSEGSENLWLIGGSPNLVPNNRVHGGQYYHGFFFYKYGIYDVFFWTKR